MKMTSKNILVIDDLKINYLVIQKYLSQYPFKIDFIQDPREVKSYLENNRPDLILMDYEMPHMNGVEVCKEIKNNPKLKDIPVVFFTSMSAAETITNAFAAGAEDYINKPVCEPELISRLNRIFQNQNLKTELDHKYEDQAALSRILSHDLNNYLSIFKTSMVSLKKINDPVNTQKKQYETVVDRIARTITRAEELVSSIREIQALTDQKIQLNVEAQSLAPLLRESIQNYQDKIESKEIKINYSEEFINKIESEKVLFEKVSALNSVIGNVLSNAVKFSKNGSVIEISCEDQSKDHLTLVIRDHGVGMPEDLVKKVFSKNEKTTRLGTANETGTGFGMPLVKMYMEKYGGSVSVSSIAEENDPQNHGTTIKLEFKKAA